jgi:hypothetical protein
MPQKLTLAAARNVPWAPTIEIRYPGAELPLSGATVKMQVRLYPGADGAALIDLTDITFEDLEDVSAGWRVLRLYPEVAQATLAGLPTGLNQPEAGDADRFFHDIVIEYSDGAVDRPAAGEFLLEPGVTIDG